MRGGPSIRLAVLVVVLLLSARVPAADISQCGQIVPARDTGTLTGNLDCSTTTQRFCAAQCSNPGLCGADPEEPCTTAADCPDRLLGGPDRPCVVIGVGLADRASLNLAGFSIVDAPGDTPSYGIMCESRCNVSGPGEVDGFAHDLFGNNATVTGLVAKNGLVGLYGYRLRLSNVTATTNSVFGISAGRLRVDGGVSASGNMGVGVGTLRIRARGLTASGNRREGLLYGRGGRNSSFVVSGFVAQNNAGAGVVNDGGGTFVDSTVSGNNGNGTGVDIGTGKRPRLIRTTCGKSAHYQAGVFGDTWGICASD